MNDYIEKLSIKLKNENIEYDYAKLCIQYASRLIDNRVPVIFDKEHFSLLLGIKSEYINKLILCTDRFYKTYTIKKKSGGERVISIPNVRLRYIQRWILDNIIYNIKVLENIKGFVPNKSILDNAREHVGKEAILTIDIKDFFPSVTFEKVFYLFYYYGYTKEMSYCLSRICTLNNSLPQGAPSSPYIANIICKKMDKRLFLLSKKIGATYSRYADDITISGNRNIVNYIEVIQNIIIDEGFQVNDKKTRIMYKNRQQRVTGLIVNEKISIPKDKIRYLRQQLHYIKKFGVTEHIERTKVRHNNIKEHLYGLAYFIKMVDVKKGESLLNELDSINWDS